MKKTPVNDFFAKNGSIRDDGRMVHDMYLLQVKKPAESKTPWDYYTCGHHPAAEAFQPLSANRVPAGQEVIHRLKTPCGPERAWGRRASRNKGIGSWTLRHPLQACSANCCSG
jgi:hypothetical protein